MHTHSSTCQNVNKVSDRCMGKVATYNSTFTPSTLSNIHKSLIIFYGTDLVVVGVPCVCVFLIDFLLCGMIIIMLCISGICRSMHILINLLLKLYTLNTKQLGHSQSTQQYVMTAPAQVYIWASQLLVNH